MASHTPTPPILASSHPPVSLSTLPLEVKSIVVEKIAEGCQLNSDHSMFRAAPKLVPDDDPEATTYYIPGPWMSHMRVISMVNREFAELAGPYLWGSVNLAKMNSAEELGYALACVIPSHAHHVRYLTTPDFEPGRVDTAVGVHEFATWGVEVLPTEPVAPRDDPAVLYGLSLLLSRAITSMPRLCRVSCALCQISDAYSKPTRRRNGRREGGSFLGPSAVALALATIGSRMEELEIFGFDAALAEGPHLASFLSHFLSLSHLSLRMHFQPDYHLNNLASTVSSLRHLTFLDVTEPHHVDEDFSSVSWSCPLETLSMNASLSFLSLVTFLGNFSTTLKTLSLYPSYFDDWDAMPPPAPADGTLFQLPYLHTLNYCTTHEEKYLNSFRLCPIEYLTIEDSPNVSLKAWEAFVQSHAATLKRVTIGVDAAASAPSLLGPGLPRVCAKNGIECMRGGISVDAEGKDVEAGGEKGDIEDVDVGADGVESAEDEAGGDSASDEDGDAGGDGADSEPED